MSADIYVLDIETTSLQGATAGGKVLEIGIARVSFDTGKVYPEYSQIINQELTDDERRCWCFENTTLTPEDVEHSPKGAIKAALDLYFLYRDGLFTSYNVEFDFIKYLHQKPFNFKPEMAPDIMITCANQYNDGYYVKAQQMYDWLCPDDPAGMGKERHRALDDAIFEGHILLRAYKDSEDIAELYDEALERWRGELYD